MKNRLLAICLIIKFVLIFSGIVNAQIYFPPEIDEEKLESTTITSFPKYSTITVDDQFETMKSGGWRPNFKHKSVLDRITLTVKDTNVVMEKYDYWFNIRVITYDLNDNMDSFETRMNLSYNPKAFTSYKDKSVFEFDSFFKFRICVLSIEDSLDNGNIVLTTELQRNFTFSNEVIVQRYYLNDYSASVSSMTGVQPSSTNYLDINWDVPAGSGPNMYELEWTVIDTHLVDINELTYDFKYNSTRIQTNSNSYRINLIYDAGIILYRVRRVRPDSVFYKYLKYSHWYPNKPDQDLVSNYGSIGKQYFTSHEDNSKNWQFSVSFAENGLKKDIVNYFDGGLKRRQGVTLINKKSTGYYSIVDESIYDYHGREAISVIPAPDATSQLKFHKDFNLNENGDPYSAIDFDSSGNLREICDSFARASAMSTESGASRYYSSNNPDQEDENANIPDAYKYPFAQTQFMQDGTGRIRRQGGIGKDHQLGTGHETRYYYGKPSQEQLDILFGTEVGYQKHYKQNAVKDPNGQISISLIDQHGRVIATSLAGGTPDNMEQIDNYEDTAYDFRNLSTSNIYLKNGSKILFNYTQLVESKGYNKFSYKVESPGFLFGCLQMDTCYSCVYDLDYKIIDDCGNVLFSFEKTIGSLNSESCNFTFNLTDEDLGEEIDIVGDSIILDLDIGNYSVHKTLSVNTDSLVPLFMERLANDSCVKTPQDFYTELYDKIDFSSCDTCLTCEESNDICEIKRRLMVQDIMPNGQYAQYDEVYDDDELIGYTPSSGPNIYDPEGVYYYQDLTSESDYKNYLGVLDTIRINGFDSFPNELGLTSFVDNFKESWAEALLPLHPEYCSYEHCLATLNETNNYDKEMLLTNTYEEALEAGYLNPLDHTNVDYPVEKDNFFFTGGGASLTSLGTSLYNEMDKFYDAPSNANFEVIETSNKIFLDIWQYSAAISYCSALEDEAELNACMLSFKKEDVKKDVFNDVEFQNLYWQKFRSLYMVLKRDKTNESREDACSNLSPIFDSKILHFPPSNYKKEDHMDSDDKETLENALLDSIENIGVCEAQVPFWTEQLKHCPSIQDTGVINPIIRGFLQVCKDAQVIGDNYNLFGANEIPDPYKPSSPKYGSFEEVLEDKLGEDYASKYCNLALIQFPKGPAHDYFNQKQRDVSDCHCESLKEETKLYVGCSDDEVYKKSEADIVLNVFNHLINDGLITGEAQSSNLFNISYSSRYNDLAALFESNIGGLMNTGSDTLFYRSEKVSDLIYAGRPNEMWLHFSWESRNHQNQNNSKCNFRLQLPESQTFEDLSLFIDIKPTDNEYFNFKLRYLDGLDTIEMLVNSPCINAFEKCSFNWESILSELSLQDFLNYYNKKYNSNIDLASMKLMYGECGAGGGGGGCAPSISKKDLELIYSFNEMMRPDTFRGEKRYLKTNEANYNCPDEYNFLVESEAYRNVLMYDFNKYNNYWWEDKDTGTWPENNIHSDPWFVGGAWIGVDCPGDGGDTIEQCFTSFGNPFGDFDSIFLTTVDSIANLRYDWKLGEFIVDLIDRDHPGVLKRATWNSCYTECKGLSNSFSYTDTYEGTSINIDGAFKKETATPFFYLLNKLAESSSLTDVSGGIAVEKNIDDYLSDLNYHDIYNPADLDGGYDRSLIEDPKYKNFFGSIYPISGGNKYFIDKEHGVGNDSLLVAYIGDPNSSEENKLCQINLVRKYGPQTVLFEDIEFFDSFSINTSKVKEMMKKGREDDASFFFSMRACKINGSDTIRQDVEGWTTCYSLYSLDIRTIQGMSMSLPKNFAPECQCLTCPEVAEAMDSFFIEYPYMRVNHDNYSIMVTNYLNTYFNTNLSFVEYQNYVEGCYMEDHVTIPHNACDYRVTIEPDSDCETHLDSMLTRLQDSSFVNLEFSKNKWNNDSLVYCFDFTGNESELFIQIIDSIDSYLDETDCNTSKTIEDYYTDKTILVISDVITNGSLDDIPTYISSYSSSYLNSASINISTFSDAKHYNNLFNGNSNLYTLDFSNLTEYQQRRLVDSLRAHCNLKYQWHEIYASFLIKNNESIFDEESICIENQSSEEECESCEEIRAKLIDYQYANPSPSKWQASLVQDFIDSSHSWNSNVFFENEDCQTCGDKNVFVCEDPTDASLAIFRLLQALVDENKHVDTGVSLASYTSILNDIAPGVTLSTPKYYAIEKNDQWEIEIKYNANYSDFLEIPLNFEELTSLIKPRTFPSYGETYGLRVFGFKEDQPIELELSTSIVTGKCCMFPEMTLCPKSINREIPQETPCKQNLILHAKRSAIQLYNQYIDSLRDEFVNQYVSHCFSNVKEKATWVKQSQKYHTTLYYYDLAGNLSKTVPPAGVNKLTYNNDLAEELDTLRDIFIQEERIYTEHSLSTLYQYNSLNQLVWQSTPDGGQSRFYYDRLGRLVASQNAKQKALGNVYSYTKYDQLGRIREVGQIQTTKLDSVDLFEDTLYSSGSYFYGWLNTGTRTQITRTYYDTSYSQEVAELFTTNQDRLRGRVSTIAYFDADGTDEFTRATHFTYDIHGNVKELIQDLPELEEMNQRYKRISYNYDLVSGNVKSVSYQDSMEDQFHHKYTYDANNRITLVETSKDKVIWDKDAEYNYYKHGPLARTVLGEHAVQGIDYAYTIQGWLKGVNSESLVAENDMGRDGTGLRSLLTARDAYGFSLSYFNGDYSPINSDSSKFLADKSNSPLSDASYNLFNGNIKGMVTSIQPFMTGGTSPMATMYKYDQLNRIKEMKTFNNMNISSNTWNTGTLSSDYQTNYNYDPNGNILTLERNTADATKLKMDDLEYFYKTGTNQLTHVTDDVTNNKYGHDIDNQNSNNYQYDEIGNLTKDKAEGIDSIYWNVYGKISKIIRHDTSSRNNLEFRYDASGQRIAKIEEKINGYSATYYVRDASGNVMSVYQKDDLVDLENLNFNVPSNWILENMEVDSLIELIMSYYDESSQYTTSYISYVANHEDFADVYGIYTFGEIMDAMSGYEDIILHNFTSYSNSTENDELYNELKDNHTSNLLSSLENCYTFRLTLYEKLLGQDGLDEWLVDMDLNDNLNFDQLYNNLRSNHFSWVTFTTNSGQRISDIRTYCSDFQIAAEMDGLYGPTGGNAFFTFLNNSITSTLLDNFLQQIDFQTLLDKFAECGYAGNLNSFFKNNFSNQNIIQDIINDYVDPHFLINELARDDLIKFYQYCFEHYTGSASFILSGQSNMSISKYLGWIEKRWGKSTVEDILEDQEIMKKVILAEQHLYGSSRVGVYRAKKLLQQYNIEDGTKIDSFTSVSSNTHFIRTLTRKEYELSNHLGNVLATVLDRKSANNDTTTNATIAFYKADIIQATHYYPFGMQMMSYKQEEYSAYRFGNNTQERDDEIYGEGNSYSAEFWQYDARLGRRWNVDPIRKHYESSYACFGNSPITIIDHNGADSIFYNQDGSEKRRVEMKGSHTYFLIHENGNLKINGELYYQGNSYNSFFGDQTSMGLFTNVDKDKIADKEKVLSVMNEYVDSQLEEGEELTQLDFYAGSPEGGTYDYKNQVLDPSQESEEVAMKTAYMHNGILYNRNEAGNILWGATASRANVPYGGLWWAAQGYTLVTELSTDEMGEWNAILIGYYYHKGGRPPLNRNALGTQTQGEDQTKGGKNPLQKYKDAQILKEKRKKAREKWKIDQYKYPNRGPKY